jgi:hypothetical protein
MTPHNDLIVAGARIRQAELRDQAARDHLARLVRQGRTGRRPLRLLTWVPFHRRVMRVWALLRPPAVPCQPHE